MTHDVCPTCQASSCDRDPCPVRQFGAETRPVKDSWLWVRPEPESVTGDDPPAQLAICSKSGPLATWGRREARFESVNDGPWPDETFAWLEITTQCNQRCLHCFLGDRLRRGHVPETMVLGAIRDLEQFPVQEVVISGGEPTLHPGFSRILALAAQGPWQVRVLSNGLFPSTEVVRALGHPQIAVEVPLLGWEADHDRMTGVRGSFDRVMNTLRLYRSAGVRVILTTTLTRYAVSAGPKLAALAQELGISFAPSLLHPVGNALEHWSQLVPEYAP